MANWRRPIKNQNKNVQFWEISIWSFMQQSIGVQELMNQRAIDFLL